MQFRPKSTFTCWLCAFALFVLAASARASIVEVGIQGFGFNGQHVTISVGDTVRWTQFDNVTHTITEGTDGILNGNEAWHQSMVPFTGGTNPTFSVTFDAAFLAANTRPGNRYDYFCIPHSTFMRGSITVDTGPGAPFCFCQFPICLGINSDAGAGCANATYVFNGARMLGAGTASVATDDLVLAVDRVPSTVAIVLFRSSAADGVNPVAFVDGLLCLQAPFVRTRVLASGASGSASFGPGLLTLLQHTNQPVVAGQTWHFQAWYPEPPGLGNCGLGSNVTNGYTITFTP